MPDKEIYPVLSVPEFEPKAITKFVVTLTPPDAGWMTFDIRCDEVTLQLWASYVFCPLKRMKAWLEAVASDQEASLEIDPEGYLEHLFIKNYAAEGDIVRFTSWLQIYGLQEEHPELNDAGTP